MRHICIRKFNHNLQPDKAAANFFAVIYFFI